MKKKNNLGLYFVVAVIALIAYGGLKSKFSGSADSTSKIVVSQPINNEAKKEDTTLTDTVAVEQKEEVKTETAKIETKNYQSKDKSWKISYPKEFLLKNEDANRVTFQSGGDILNINQSDKIVGNFKGYVGEQSESVVVGGEKATKIVKESRDHVGGYPSSKMIVANFSHAESNYQITYEFNYNGPESDKSLDIANNILKSFSFK